MSRLSKTRYYKILGKAHFKHAARREDGLITHEMSSDTVVSHQRETERIAFEHASGEKPHEPAPVSREPYHANEGKKCSRCKQWRKLQYFGTKRIRGVIYVQSWCNFCMAEWAAEQYRKSTLILRG